MEDGVGQEEVEMATLQMGVEIQRLGSEGEEICRRTDEMFDGRLACDLPDGDWLLELLYVAAQVDDTYS